MAPYFWSHLWVEAPPGSAGIAAVSCDVEQGAFMTMEEYFGNLDIDHCLFVRAV